MSDELERPKIDWSLVVDRARDMKLSGVLKPFLRMRVPKDAETARVPEEDPPKLFIPPEHAINDLIAQARTLEREASRLVDSGGPRELIEWNDNAALRSRVKALCLHLGIEEVR